MIGPALQGSYPLTNPFGATGDTSPAGWLQSDAHGPKFASFTAKTGFAYHNHLHEGVDYACPIGTNVLAVEAAILRGKLWSTQRGKYVLLWWRTACAGQAVYVAQHLSTYGNQSPGASVAKGAVVGRSGQSGAGVTGPHLHDELRVTSSTSDDWLHWQSWLAINPSRCGSGGDLASSPLIVPGAGRKVACSGGYLWSAPNASSTRGAALVAGQIAITTATVKGGSWGFSCNGTAKSGTAWYVVSALNGKLLTPYQYAAVGRFA